MSAVTEDSGSTRKAPSIAALAIVVVVLTLIAAGGGWFLGGQLGLAVPEAASGVEGQKTPATEAMPTGSVVVLKPILTNVKIPQDVWIRLEAGLIVRPGEAISDELSTAVAGDFMAFLRTVNLMQLRGPAGLEYLRMDLQERARMRTEGKVDKVYIWALVME
ncbi:flagellar basal body-associated FliL family protein [Phyllobacterium sp. YR531]|uniref:flagellar basal body-associated FliL family protein n=1 Tax=Phyllobacterium sp. YR531 TaxID=1144343 RepID=UPI00026F86C0|nr:flagellar basal body-associated FliL family protein [Phyllobacterium sp. YR531]EJN06380.1 flagellar basal body-associated protein [Phyllobacterium sp. YR531]